jgi:hypothetical protein
MNGGKSWNSRLRRWWYRLLYPNYRRKDAGYIANVLAEYKAVPLPVRMSLPNFAEIEGCVTALQLAIDADADADVRRLEELRQILSTTTPGAGAREPAVGADPMNERVWLQTYMRQVFQVEKAILELQSVPALFARAPMLLERFRSVADQRVEMLKRQLDGELSADRLSKLWDTWSKSGDDKAKGEVETWLRQKLASLLNEVHWRYAQSQIREELFLGQQLTVIGGFLAGAIVLLAAFTFGCNCSYKLNIAVMFFGLLGAFTSIMRRMRSDADQHGGGAESSFKELTALAYGKIGISISLLFGVVFSLVLLLVFYGGLAEQLFNPKLTGLVVPSLPLTWAGDQTCAGTCFFGLNPDSAGNFGKLMVWSFLAGFAEQLVPDALNRLTTKALEKKA